jgi:P2-related tail formation protein
MSKYENNKILTEGWNVNSQTPIDDRTIFNDLTDLINLGVDNQEAYRYYEGLKAWVISERKEYEWKESSTGELTSSFQYASDIITNNIVYSNKFFNWVEIQSGGSSVNVQVDNPISLSANVSLVINITGATNISNVEVYDSNSNRITHGLNIKISNNTVTLESNVNLIDLIVKTTF